MAYLWYNICMRSIYEYRILQNDLLKYLPDVNMSDRDKEIVKSFFENRYTFAEFGKIYGLSGERIRQIITQFYWKAFHITSLEKD